MSDQPRDPKGNFIDSKKIESDDNVHFYISEFESRTIGNRLFRLADRYQKLFDDLEASIRLDQDCRYWGEKFHEACALREDYDEEYYENGKKRHTDSNYHVLVRMSDYECWSLGNRLFEVGEWFDKKGYERIAVESKWIARRFHAEWKEQTDQE